MRHQFAACFMATLFACSVAAQAPSSPGSLLPDPSSQATLTKSRASGPGESPVVAGRFAGPHRIESLLFDTAENGAVWARGKNFKSSFDASGATFIPFLGSKAPANYPVAFMLSSVEAGGRALSVSSTSPAVRNGKTVTIDRGCATEIYALAFESIEQMFRFDQAPRSGDLVIHMSVETSLSCEPAADGGLVFANALGGVKYGRAEVIDAAGSRAPVTVSSRENGIDLTVSASFLATAAFPITVDPVITTFTIASSQIPGANVNQWLNADVAYESGADRYVVALENVFSATDHDVYVKAYDTSGVQVGSIATIDFTGFKWAEPKIASNGNAHQYLVVSERTLSGGATVISGRTVSATLGIGPIFQISGSEGGRNPDVGGDPHPNGPTFYCVCWEGGINGSSNIYYNIVQTSGVLNFPISQYIGWFPTLTHDTHPSISKSDGAGISTTQRWIIVWERAAPGFDLDIYGAMINWDGVVIDQGFPVDTSAEYTSAPAVSSVTQDENGVRKWMVVYQATQGSGPFAIIHEDLYAAVYYGTSANPVPTIAANITQYFPNGSLNRDEVRPSVDTDGCRFTVGFSEYGSLFAADQGVPHLVTLHTDFDISIAMTEVPFALNANAGADDHIQVASTYSGGGPQYIYAAVWDSVNAANSDQYVEGALWLGYSAAANGGPSAYFNYALPNCGNLNIVMSGFPGLGSIVGAQLTGVEGVPFILIGTSVPPISLCTSCVLGVDPTTAILLQTDALSVQIPCLGELVNQQVALQGADIGSTQTGCPGSVAFSLSEEVIVTFF